MIVLQVNGLTKSFSGTDILENVQLEVQHRDRVALVGRNGAGKSTLLKIIAGEMTADSGDLIVPKDIRIGYLEQHSGIDSALNCLGRNDDRLRTTSQHGKTASVA